MKVFVDQSVDTYGNYLHILDSKGSLIYILLLIINDLTFTGGENQQNVSLLLGQSRAHPSYKDEIFSHNSRFFWSKEKCYPDFGCFSPISFLGFKSFPMDGHSMQVVFELYTRHNPNTPNHLSFNDSSKIASSSFDVKKETKMITHGFVGRCDKNWAQRLIKELLAKGDFNVICVDWRRGAYLSSYLRAAANTQMVGKIIALFLEMVKNRFESIHQRSHLIGFSLGAHVMGYAGFKTPGIKRITGLDPAGPAFIGSSSDIMLDPSDASFVDVIHTNGQSIFKGGAGTLKRLGHIDFYSNGGAKQPGCTNAILSLLNIFNLFSKEGRKRFKCNHERAVQIFIESINCQYQFEAKLCHSWRSYQEGACRDQIAIAAGYYADKFPVPVGTYYFVTRAHPPLCGHQLQIQMDYKSSYRFGAKYRGTVTLTLGYKEKKERHTLINGYFRTPGSKSKLLFLESLNKFTSVYLTYRKRGWFNWKKYLRINSIRIRDVSKGIESLWEVQTAKKAIRSGSSYNLKRIS